MPTIADCLWSRSLAVLALATLLGGCMTNPYTWDKKNARKMESTLEQAGKDGDKKILSARVGEVDPEFEALKEALARF